MTACDCLLLIVRPFKLSKSPGAQSKIRRVVNHWAYTHPPYEKKPLTSQTKQSKASQSLSSRRGSHSSCSAPFPRYCHPCPRRYSALMRSTSPDRFAVMIRAGCGRTIVGKRVMSFGMYFRNWDAWNVANAFGALGKSRVYVDMVGWA